MTEINITAIAGTLIFIIFIIGLYFFISSSNDMTADITAAESKAGLVNAVNEFEECLAQRNNADFISEAFLDRNDGSDPEDICNNEYLEDYEFFIRDVYNLKIWEFDDEFLDSEHRTWINIHYPDKDEIHMGALHVRKL